MTAYREKSQGIYKTTNRTDMNLTRSYIGHKIIYKKKLFSYIHINKQRERKIVKIMLKSALNKTTPGISLIKVG